MNNIERFKQLVAARRNSTSQTPEQTIPAKTSLSNNMPPSRNGADMIEGQEIAIGSNEALNTTEIEEDTPMLTVDIDNRIVKIGDNYATFRGGNAWELFLLLASKSREYIDPKEIKDKIKNLASIGKVSSLVTYLEKRLSQASDKPIIQSLKEGRRVKHRMLANIELGELDNPRTTSQKPEEKRLKIPPEKMRNYSTSNVRNLVYKMYHMARARHRKGYAVSRQEIYEFISPYISDKRKSDLFDEAKGVLQEVLEKKDLEFVPVEISESTDDFFTIIRKGYGVNPHIIDNTQARRNEDWQVIFDQRLEEEQHRNKYQILTHMGGNRGEVIVSLLEDGQETSRIEMSPNELKLLKHLTQRKEVRANWFARYISEAPHESGYMNQGTVFLTDSEDVSQLTRSLCEKIHIWGKSIEVHLDETKSEFLQLADYDVDLHQEPVLRPGVDRATLIEEVEIAPDRQRKRQPSYRGKKM